MRRRQFIGLLASASLAGAGLPGCSRKPPLQVGVHPWIGYESLYLAEEFGWLKDTVALVKGGTGSESVRGLREGRLDAAAVTLDEALRVMALGVPLTVIAVMDVSAGADVIMARAGMQSLADLRGKKVAVELAGAPAIMLLRALEQAGLEPSDLEIVDLPVHQHSRAWQRGEIDASVSYEPVASVLETRGAVRLFDSRSLPDTIFDVLVVNRERAGTLKPALRDLLAGHFRGLSHLVRSFHDAVYRIATRQQVTPEAVRRALATVMLPDLSANQRYLAPSGRVEQVAASLNQLMLREGLLKMPVDLKGLCDASFLPRGPL
ncbi:ABC transporter substrate-binding protein [Marinobacter goseongensis]|uniref:ABC transporter substrate-binding protein n=1 Tax=Marinobacter goseongensis TaxID=453838 RepID=UPI0020047504|nr:ABC transporter substrate-binding protein [Marinobacter goseongensis]MCK7550548.1 ABC transporter substrate-binding protein [Marinobacter goseongensis]